MSDVDYLDAFGRQVKRFVQLESAAGLMLIGATVLAMVTKNSMLSEFYAAFLNLEGEIRLGALSVEKPLFLWVNDFQMAIFFLLVGLEIKREVRHGHLADRQALILPTLGAIGGVVVPALIYLYINRNDPGAASGWAVPTATDIAFALGVLAMVGSRVSTGIKVFLMTLAILDDLIAIVVIALFYTSGLSLTSLWLAAGVIALLFLANRFGIRSLGVYMVLGIVLWTCVLKSGVHATLAGVVTAMFIPGDRRDEPDSPAESLIEMLHPWVAFLILPLFAFVNAGVALEGMSLARLLEPVPLGITLGLFIGKPVGVFFFVAAVVALRFGRLPEGVNWVQLFGVAVLCGVGFTMSLFIGGLAFAEGGPGYARIDRLGILIGSGLSAVCGYLILRFSLRGSAKNSH